MAAISKWPATFSVTPHKHSMCVLVQVFAPPSQISIPFPFSSVSQHNRLGIFILSLTKACDGIFEATLDEVIAQLREVGGLLNHWLSDHLTRRLSSLDDFFADLRGNLRFRVNVFSWGLTLMSWMMIKSCWILTLLLACLYGAAGLISIRCYLRYLQPLPRSSRAAVLAYSKLIQHLAVYKGYKG